jgi:hypothetical protein
MTNLDKQTKRKMGIIKIANQIYKIKKPSSQSVFKLSNKLVNWMYNSIKEYNTKVYNIARNLNFKAENIKNAKDYGFYDKYKFD